MGAAAPPVFGGFAACHLACGCHCGYSAVIAAAPPVIWRLRRVIAATPLVIGLRPSIALRPQAGLRRGTAG